MQFYGGAAPRQVLLGPRGAEASGCRSAFRTRRRKVVIRVPMRSIMSHGPPGLPHAGEELAATSPRPAPSQEMRP